MAFPQMSNPAQGMSASAGMGQHNHGRAQQGAFAAQQRLAMARNLGGQASPQGQPGQGAGDFRQHAAQASGLQGASVPEVHGAIDALAQAGHFTPLQATALKAHKGALQGPQGKMTVAKIGQAMKMGRMARAQQRPPMAGMQQPQRPPMAPMGGQPPGMPSQGPVAGGGMPAGMGQ